MDYELLLKSDYRLRIRQLTYIREKLARIPRFREFSDMVMFYHKLNDEIKKYENYFTASGLYNLSNIAKSRTVSESVLLSNRFHTFVYEMRYESLAVNYHDAFFGFYHPEKFTLFGLPTSTVYNFGAITGGYRDADYDKMYAALRRDPDMILREREKVTKYIMRGCETSVFKRNGEPFPIDLTVPGGY